MSFQYHSRKYSVNENFFSTRSPEMAYVLGFWYADGDMKHDKSYRVRFHSLDVDHLKLIRKVFDSDAKIYLTKKLNSQDKCQTLCLHSKKLYYDLKTIGGKRNKSRRLTFPKLPDKFYKDFFRGYFDGDGSVHYIKYKASKNGKYYTEIRSNFTCGSKIFLKQIRKYLSDNLNLSKRVIGQYGPHQFKLGYGQSDTFRLLRYMYYPDHGISLKRKAIYLNELKKKLS